MISEVEILRIINEIHQYDAILVELKDGAIFGILKGIESEPVYFRTKIHASTREERRALLDAITVSVSEAHLDAITLETLLNALRGMKARHVWLERRSPPRREMAFLSLRELQDHLRGHHT